MDNTKTSPKTSKIRNLILVLSLGNMDAQCGHVLAGDLNIARNQKLRDCLCKGPKIQGTCLNFLAPDFGIIMDACKEYARRHFFKVG